MSLEQAGYGSLGGLIVAALGILGIHRRIDKKVDKSEFEATSRSIEKSFANIEKILDIQQEDIKYIRTRLDTIVNGMIEK